MGRFFFLKSYRLTRQFEFDAVFRKSCFVKYPFFSFFFCENDKDTPRLGLIVTKKSGGAVLRASVRRMFREYFRLHRSDMKAFDIVVLVHKNLLGVHLKEECWGCFDRFRFKYLSMGF